LPEPRHYNDTGADDLDPVLAAELRDRLQSSAARTEELVGRRFDWW
jgi:hypothetical protein